MRSLILSAAALLIISPMAMANVCRSLYIDPVDREDCIKVIEKTEASLRGDWYFQISKDESGNPAMVASNFAVPDYKISDSQNLKKKITFSCVGDIFPIVSLFPGVSLSNSAEVRLKFDGEDYRYLSQIEPFESKSRLNDGAIRIINRDTINKLLSSTMFYVGYEGVSGSFIEHTYTLSGSEAITSSKNTFRCLE